MNIPDIPDEEWRDIPGYVGYYQVSNMARVKSLDRWTRQLTPTGIPCVRLRPGKILKPFVIKRSSRGNAYYGVALSVDGRKRTLQLAWLVAKTFLPPRPEGKQICHGANGSEDDSLTNIYYDTPENNNGRDKERDGTLRYGSNHGMAKLTESKVIDIIQRRRNGESARSIANRYGIKSTTTIYNIMKATHWSRIERDNHNG